MSKTIKKFVVPNVLREEYNRRNDQKLNTAQEITIIVQNNVDFVRMY